MKHNTVKCDRCGNVKEYFNKYSAARASKTLSCGRCKFMTDEAARVRKEENSNLGRFCVYHLPAEYYVGMTGDPVIRMNGHRRDKMNLEDFQILSWHDTWQEAKLKEAEWHNKGYYGSEERNESRFIRSLYTHSCN